MGKYQEWLEPDGLLRLEAWARDGLTMEQVAHNCGCATQTLLEWRKAYPAISAALKRGREVADIEVENALYKRAIGYSYTETMEEETNNGFKRRTTSKQVIPDVTAQIIWLKNRKPEQWRDKPKEQDDGMQKTLQVVFGDDMEGAEE